MGRGGTERDEEMQVRCEEHFGPQRKAVDILLSN